MKRTVKFRGRDSAGNYRYSEFIYGDLLQNEGCYLIAAYDDSRRVEPDSIAQLVGYDEDGREVYEGDHLISPYGYEYTAELYAYPVTCNFKLKEEV